MNCAEIDNSARGRPLDVLVIGYGNTLRRDDGAGPAVVARMSGMHEGDRCAFSIVHQLAPENVEEIGRARRAVFVDASVGVAPGKIRVSRLSSREPGGRALTHFVSPQTLLWMSQKLFGRSPAAWSVEIGVADLSVGEALSPAVDRACARLAGHLGHRLRWWLHSPELSASLNASKEDFYVRT